MPEPEGICDCTCALCTEGDHCENPDDECFVRIGPNIIDLPDNVSEVEATALQAHIEKETAQVEFNW